MKNLKKHIYWIISTILLGIVFALFLPRSSSDALSFQVQGPGGVEDISLYASESGKGYVFLPSYAELEQVTILLNNRNPVTIGDTTISDGMDCGSFLLQKEYPVTGKDLAIRSISFYRSANVAALYIDTRNGSMDRIHENKDHEEFATFSLYTPEGELDHTETTMRIKGRGQVSWEADKRPYLMTLSESHSLLHMESGEKWVLLANAYDQSNLHNELALTLARKSGLEWTPDSAYVDLYLNDQYAGLYLLTEKVNSDNFQKTLSQDPNSFLCKVDLTYRTDSMNHPFVSSMGRTVDIIYPLEPTESDFQRIQNEVAQMESAMLSHDPFSRTRKLNLDSWAKKYMVDEITGNGDSDIASVYFYYLNGQFHAGPVWDYDKSFRTGRFLTPSTFFARLPIKSHQYISQYYGSLSENDIFNNYVEHLYAEEFIPILHSMVEKDIDILATRIADASYMNTLRWRSMFGMSEESPIDPDSLANDISDFLTARMDFLSSAWIDHKQYCTVQFETAQFGAYYAISLEKGTVPLGNVPGIDLENTQWYDLNTDQPFDPSQPIQSDVILVMHYEENAEQPPAAIPTSRLLVAVVMLSFGAMIILFAGVLFLDLYRRKKERRDAHAPTGSNLPS